MKTSAQVEADIDAFDRKMWSQVNCSIGHPRDWIGYCITDEPFIEYQLLHDAYADALIAEGKL